MVAVEPGLSERVEREVRDFLSRKAPHQSEAILRLGLSDTIWGPVDSMLVLALVGHLEKTFGLKVQPKDFTPENLGTIGKIAAFVERSVSSP